jgi:hypothetical protein
MEEVRDNSMGQKCSIAYIPEKANNSYVEQNLRVMSKEDSTSAFLPSDTSLLTINRIFLSNVLVLWVPIMSGESSPIRNAASLYWMATHEYLTRSTRLHTYYRT